MSDYLHEVKHAAERIERLERAIDAAVQSVPEPMRAVIDALTGAAGHCQSVGSKSCDRLGELSRFERPRHLRRIVVEAAWAYRHQPSCGEALKERQKHLSPTTREIAWKAQHRLHGRYTQLLVCAAP